LWELFANTLTETCVYIYIYIYICTRVYKEGLQVLFHIVTAKFPIPENFSAYVSMILKEFWSSKINGLVMKNFFRNRFFTYDYSLWDGGDIRFCGQKQTLIFIIILWNTRLLKIEYEIASNHSSTLLLKIYFIKKKNSEHMWSNSLLYTNYLNLAHSN
jgi:hypothetical protein